MGRDPIPSPRNLWSEKVKPSPPKKKFPKDGSSCQISGLREIVCVRRYVDRQMERHNTRRDGRNHHNYIHADRHEALYFKITEYTGPEWIFFNSQVNLAKLKFLFYVIKKKKESRYVSASNNNCHYQSE